MRKFFALCAVSVMVLTGCSSDSDVKVSAACADALEAFGLVGADGEESALTETTRACTTASEYIAGVKANPESWWFDRAEEVDEKMVMYLACGKKNESEPTCTDAKKQGLI